MKKSLILFSLLSFLNLFSQSAPVLWTKSYGGSGEDHAQSVLATPDGGCIVAGYTSSTNFDVTDNHSFTYDFWVVKLNDLGNLQWKKCYGGSSVELAYNIQATSDNAYVICGYTQSNNGDVLGLHGYKDFWVIKIDLSGNLIWQKTFGGSVDEEAYCIKETTDGGFIVVGYAKSIDGDLTINHGNSDFWVVKLNSSGDLLWQKTYGGTNEDEARSVQQADDGGYVIIGFTTSNDGDVVTGFHGSRDYWIIKVDTNGVLQWQKTIGGSNYDMASSSEKTNDGGYIICGTSNSYDGDITNSFSSYDFFVVKINNSGNIVWHKNYGGSQYDGASCIKKTSDGNYLIAGSTYSNNDDLLGNLNSNGTSSFWIIKINDLGVIQMKTPYGTQSGYYGYAVDQTTDGGYVATGAEYSGGTNEQYHIIKLGTTLNTSNFDEFKQTYLYPNPSSGFLNINCLSTINQGTIYDIQGKSIQVTISNNTVDISQLHTGTYLIQLEDENGNSICKKFIKQ